MINLALKLACEDELDEIVVNITDMTGFASPGPAYRRWVAGRWADTVEGKLAVAMVARHEHICPDKTGLLVAAEKGLKANIFVTEAEAIAWLNKGLKATRVTGSDDGADERRKPLSLGRKRL